MLHRDLPLFLNNLEIDCSQLHANYCSKLTTDLCSELEENPLFCIERFVVCFLSVACSLLSSLLADFCPVLDGSLSTRLQRTHLHLTCLEGLQLHLAVMFSMVG